MLTATSRIVARIAIACIAIVFLVFAIDNREFVTISLFPLPYAAQMPKFLLMILCFALGVVVGGLQAWLRGCKSRREAKAEHQRVLALQNELNALEMEKTSSLAVTSSPSFSG